MQKIQSLNSLRGIAAGVVALDHFTLLSGHAPPESSAYYIATFAGSFGVGLFFLISGFVIPFSLWKSNTPEFITRRIFRLLPVFMVCCLLRWIQLVMAGGAEFNMHFLGVYALNTSMFGALVLPLNSMIEPIVWSLEIEVKFYIICALIFHFFRNSPQRVCRATLVYVALNSVVAHNFSIVGQPWHYEVAFGLSVVPFMLNGFFVSLMFSGKINREECLVGIICATGSFMLAPCPTFITFDKGLPSWVLAAAVFGYALANRDKLAALSSRVAQLFGDISYPLYAIHVTIASVVLAYFPGGFLVKVPGFIACTIAAAWLIHMLVERPSIRISKSLAWQVSTKAKVRPIEATITSAETAG